MKTDPNILILLDEEPNAVARIRALCPRGRVTIGPWVQGKGMALPPELLRDAEILYCELPPDNFDDLKSLRWMQLTSAGYAQVLKLPILARGIRVTNGLGNFDVPIAEWSLMMMLWWHRSMLDAQADQRARVFNRATEYQRELRGSTVGFYGYGGLARETARMAKAMGLKVWALARHGAAKRPLTFCVEGTGDPDGVLPDRVFGPDQMAEFMGGLDYLVVAVPLTGATRGIIGEKELRMLRSSAVLINPARAHVIEEEAYVRCLREKWIRGSSLDVHYAYPLPPEHPLWSLPNVIMTAHVSGGSAGPQFISRSYGCFVQNVERYCSGQPLLNELSRTQLEGK